MIYPSQTKLFLSIEDDKLGEFTESTIEEIARLGLVTVDGRHNVATGQDNIQMLMLLGRTITETFNAMPLHSIYCRPANLNKGDLEQKSQEIAQRLGRLHGINAPEFFDKGVFSSMLTTLKHQDYLDNDGSCDQERSQALADLLYSLLSPEVCLTIKESICQASETP